MAACFAYALHFTCRTQIYGQCERCLLHHRSRLWVLVVGDASERAPCSVDTCLVDCAYSLWSTWSECAATCNPAAPTAQGTSERVRQVTSPAANGGAQCDANLTDSRACAVTTCPVCRMPW
jgi:hypothetical protein